VSVNHFYWTFLYGILISLFSLSKLVLESSSLDSPIWCSDLTSVSKINIFCKMLQILCCSFGAQAIMTGEDLSKYFYNLSNLLSSDLITVKASFFVICKKRILSMFPLNNVIDVKSIQHPKLWGAGLCHVYCNRILVRKKSSKLDF